MKTVDKKVAAARNLFYAILLLFFFSGNGLMAVEQGRLPLHNFSKDELPGTPEKFFMVQDRRGLIYSADEGSVFEYDGVEWRKILTTDQAVYSLAVDSQGFIYVGSLNEIGCLAPDRSGNLIYISLMDQVAPADRVFKEVWRVHCTSEGAYFFSNARLFRWDGKRLKVWPIDGSGFSLILNGQLCFYLEDQGFSRLVNDRVEMFDPKKRWGIDTMVTLPLNEKQLLLRQMSLTDKKNDLTVADSATLLPDQTVRIPADVQRLTQNYNVYGTMLLRNGDIIFNLLEKGALHTDKFFQIQRILDEKSGLNNNGILFSYQDTQGGLWLGTKNGHTRVEIESPMCEFGKAEGVDQNILSIIRFRGELYLALNGCVLYWQEDHFAKLSNLNEQCWTLAILQAADDPVQKEHLLLGCYMGVREIKDKKTAPIVFPATHVRVIHQSKQDPSQVFIAHRDGIQRLVWQGGRFKTAIPARNINDYTLNWVEDQKGNIWGREEQSGQLFKLNNQKDSLSVIRFGPNQGLPQGLVQPVLVDGQLVFQTEQGFYEVAENQGGSYFKPLTKLNQAFAVGRRWKNLRILQKNGPQGFWVELVWPDRVQLAQALPDHKNEYRFQTSPFETFDSRSMYTTIYSEENGITWFGGPDNLYRYDHRLKRDTGVSYSVLIRRIELKGNNTLFGGSFYREKNGRRWPVASQPETMIPVLRYQKNPLIFYYAAPFFDRPERTVYQYFLQGYDQDWSGWSRQTRKEYTSLPEGQYQFRVLARNVYEQQSQEGNFRFTILPPWYRTTLVYIGFGLAGILFFYGSMRINSRRLIAAKERLEKIVAERTAEVVRQRDEISKKSEEITRQKDEIEAYASDLYSTNRQLTEAKNALWGEMELAKKIQTVLLPEKPQIPGYEIAAYMKPADEVGGDYYDVINVVGAIHELPLHWIVIGDVSGHGVPAGLVMMMAQTSLRSVLEESQARKSPEKILQTVNKIIFENIKKLGENKYMTITLMSVQENGVIYFSGLHQDIMIYRFAKKDVELVETQGMWIGMMDDIEGMISVDKLTLQPGDVMLLYTDGIPEALDLQGQLFSDKKLSDVFSQTALQTPEEIKIDILDSLKEYQCQDDVTLMVIKKL